MYRVFFDTDMNLVDWLRQYAQTEEERSFLRDFLGKMIFSGEALKSASSFRR
jgi:ATPase subunit of ABC transporter with duplicated ATPase domains